MRQPLTQSNPSVAPVRRRSGARFARLVVTGIRLGRMADQAAIHIEGENGRIVHATWSRSGRNLILTVSRDDGYSSSEQVLLSPEKTSDLAAFMQAGRP